MKVVIDKCLCNGQGICDSICCQLCCERKGNTEKFQQEIETEEFEFACRKAQKYCPAGAITLEQ